MENQKVLIVGMGADVGLNAAIKNVLEKQSIKVISVDDIPSFPMLNDIHISQIPNLPRTGDDYMHYHHKSLIVENLIMAAEMYASKSYKGKTLNETFHNLKKVNGAFCKETKRHTRRNGQHKWLRLTRRELKRMAGHLFNTEVIMNGDHRHG